MHFRRNILAMKPYKPPLEGRAKSDMALLDFNERTIPLPRPVLEKFAAWCLSGATRLYPEYDGLLEKLSAWSGVGVKNLFFGNGSDQLLENVFRAVVDPGDLVVLPTPSFAMYGQCAALCDAEVERFEMLAADPLAELEDKLRAGARLAILCQPNNPTGTLLPYEGVRALSKKYAQVWFLIDEAYAEFSGVSLLAPGRPLPENVVVTRTFSKAFGMAGLRFGWMAAPELMVEQCAKIRGPYDVNQFAAVAAGIALDHREEIFAYVEEIMNVEKPRLERNLARHGVVFIPSSSNFIMLLKPPAGLEAHLFRSGIRVRSIHAAGHAGNFRISIGDAAAMNRLYAALDAFFGASAA